MAAANGLIEAVIKILRSESKYKTIAKLLGELLGYIVIAVIGIGAFVWLIVYDRKLALAIFLILWSNNVSIKLGVRVDQRKQR
jgi:hypothetical protein